MKRFRIKYKSRRKYKSRKIIKRSNSSKRNNRKRNYRSSRKRGGGILDGGIFDGWFGESPAAQTHSAPTAEDVDAAKTKAEMHDRAAMTAKAEADAAAKKRDKLSEKAREAADLVERAAPGDATKKANAKHADANTARIGADRHAHRLQEVHKKEEAAAKGSWEDHALLSAGKQAKVGAERDDDEEGDKEYDLLRP